MSIELEERVRQLLADLGDNAEAIANRLRELGIRGVPCDGDACPIFRYLNANEVPVRTVGEVIRGDDWWIWTPVSVSEFITAFDRDRYPDLVEAVAES